MIRPLIGAFRRWGSRRRLRRALVKLQYPVAFRRASEVALERHSLSGGLVVALSSKETYCEHCGFKGTCVVCGSVHPVGDLND